MYAEIMFLIARSYSHSPSVRKWADKQIDQAFTVRTIDIYNIEFRSN